MDEKEAEPLECKHVVCSECLPQLQKPECPACRGPLLGDVVNTAVENKVLLNQENNRAVEELITDEVARQVQIYSQQGRTITPALISKIDKAVREGKGILENSPNYGNNSPQYAPNYGNYSPQYQQFQEPQIQIYPPEVEELIADTIIGLNRQYPGSAYEDTRAQAIQLLGV